MRNIIKIAVAVLIMAAAVPMRAQEWEKANDTTYIRQFVQTNGMLTEYAKPVDMAALTMKINNDLRGAALCQAGCLVTGGIATVATVSNVRNHNGKSKPLIAAATITGLAGVGLGIASIFFLNKEKVYISPDGVVIRITHTDIPKYDNKKLRTGKKRR